MSIFFLFPERVNEVAARLVAGVIATLAAVAVSCPSPVWIGGLALGFVLRVGWGPSLSPLARTAVWIAPRIAPPRLVPGRPKRFAQSIGAAVTLSSAGLAAAGSVTAAQSLLGVLVVFALLEALLGFCFGCWLFGHGQRLGWFAADACDVCATEGSAGADAVSE